MTESMDDLALEVSLVRKVRGCRTCRWFWGGVPPYGPYPAFDWLADFPAAFRGAPKLRARVVGQRLVDPGILHGCRKAPIMTIGINPNLTAYYAGTDGTRWAYPHFQNDVRYAYYYRYRTLHQESLPLQQIREWLDHDSALVAPESGTLLAVERSSDHRWMQLRVRYASGCGEVHEFAWSPGRRAVVFVDPRRNNEGGEFKKGDLLAGVVVPPTAGIADVIAERVGYYERFAGVLGRLKATVGGPLASADLRIGEDVSQHDMIACASPGWSSRYDIPRARVSENCVTNHGYVLQQVLQSRPAVIVLVGGSALEMFAGMVGDQLEIVDVDRDVFQLLHETTQERHFLRLNANGYRLRSRVIVSPHFSYSDNFQRHTRLSPAAWRAFSDDFRADTNRLRRAGRVRDPGPRGVVAIAYEGSDDPLRAELSSAGRLVLDAYFYDPLQMMADALAQEVHANTIAYDPSIGRLRRAEGSCRFCANERWTFPEGCPYGRDELASTPGSKFEGLAREIIARAAESKE